MSAARDAVNAVDPDLAELVDLLREHFEAKIVWVKAGEFEAGSQGIYEERGCLWTVYLPPKKGR